MVKTFYMSTQGDVSHTTKEETKSTTSHPMKDKLLQAFSINMNIIVNMLEENNKICNDLSISLAVSFIRQLLKEHILPESKPSDYYEKNAITVFHDKIKPYREEIKKRSIEFFVKHIDIIFELPNDNTTQMIKDKIINMLIYGKCKSDGAVILNVEKNHKNLWDCLDILVKISDKYMSC